MHKKLYKILRKRQNIFFNYQAPYNELSEGSPENVVREIEEIESLVRHLVEIYHIFLSLGNLDIQECKRR